MKVTVLDNQTIYDVATMYTGSSSNAMAILLANGKGVTTLYVGEELEIPNDLVNDRAVKQFEARNLSPASSPIPLDPAEWIPPTPPPSSTVRLVDSGNELLETVTIPFNSEIPVEAPDAQIEIYDQDDNLLESGSAKSGSVTPFMVNIPIPTPTGWCRPPFNTMQAGDTAIGQDFFVLPLDSNLNQILNPFGNKWRLTGVTGGYYDRTTSQYKDVDGNVTTRALAYPNDLRCDWATLSVNGDFYLWQFDDTFSSGAMTLSDANTYCQGLTIGSFSGFVVPSFNDAISIFNVAANVLFNIQELFATTSSLGIWTNTMDVYGGGAMIIRNDRMIQFQNPNTINTFSRPMPLRLTNISELP